MNGRTPPPPPPLHPTPPTPPGGTTGGTTGGTGGTGDTHPNTGTPSPKPSTHPMIFEGVVGSVDPTGNTFTAARRNTSLIFGVDANTVFQKNDKPATFADLSAGEQVRIIFRETAGGNVAASVLIHAATPHP